METIRALCYKIALRVGGLFLMVFHNPIKEAHICLWKGKHIPVYPKKSHPVAWYGSNGSWPSKAEIRFRVFVDMVGLRFEK